MWATLFSGPGSRCCVPLLFCIALFCVEVSTASIHQRHRYNNIQQERINQDSVGTGTGTTIRQKRRQKRSRTSLFCPCLVDATTQHSRGNPGLRRKSARQEGRPRRRAHARVGVVVSEVQSVLFEAFHRREVLLREGFGPVLDRAFLIGDDDQDVGAPAVLE